jgi:presenilin-like A22 family membrane protease
MKHTLKVTLFLLGLFLLTQFIGLIVVDHYLNNDLPLNIERPEMNPQTSYIALLIILLISTVVVLLLLRLKLFILWKVWFLLSVFFTLVISLSVFVSEWVALGFAILFALWRVFKPNVIVHNFTEVFIYGALAAIFVPLLNLFSIFVLLVVISVYDYVAVRKTKHMVTMAQSQGKAKVFAGLLIPYEKNIAILGGGDMGFPLMFAGVCMMQFGLTIFDWRAYIVPLCTLFLLSSLLFKSERKKFYPAMPYITLGCFLGLGVLLFFI